MHQRHLIQDQNIQKKFDENYGLLKNWPLEKYITIVSENGKSYGLEFMILADHNFDVKDAQTFIRNENVNNLRAKLIDGSHQTIQECSKDYNKPLKDVSLRFNEEFDNIIEEISCHNILRDNFIEKYVLTKTPVKLKNCFHKIDYESEELPNGPWLNDMEIELSLVVLLYFRTTL